MSINRTYYKVAFFIDAFQHINTLIDINDKSHHQPLTFKFSYSNYSSITISITIPNQSCRAISTLLTAINSAVTTVISSYVGFAFVLSVSPSFTSRILLTSNATSLTFTTGILINDILGNIPSDVLSAGTDLFTNNYNLNQDNYLCMYIENLPYQINNSSGRVTTFKIPLNATTGDVLYWQSLNGFQQKRGVCDG